MISCELWWCFKSEPIKSSQHWIMDILSHNYISFFLSLSNKRVTYFSRFPYLAIKTRLKIVLNNYFFLILTGFADNYTCWSCLGWLEYLLCDVGIPVQDNWPGTDENTWKDGMNFNIHGSVSKFSTGTMEIIEYSFVILTE